jgi:2-polyprenyl-3-methyl-5-hydroxy-6-metoxy-1,4-benzoquinol methylase
MGAYQPGIRLLRHGRIPRRPDLAQADRAGGGGRRYGKSLLHLQCHFGQDTLSWARLGAKVTGIDLSPEAIARAEALAKELGIDARFLCA